MWTLVMFDLPVITKHERQCQASSELTPENVV